MRHTSTKDSDGATIVELIIVISVIGSMIGLLFGPFNDLYVSSSQGLRSLVQTSDVRGALRTIERDVVLASKFLSENNIDDLLNNIPGKPTSPKWAWTGNPSADPTKRVLIVEAFGSKPTTVGTISGVRDIIVSGPDCTTPLKINYAYYVSNNNLYRRTIKPVGSNTGCNGTVAQNRTCRIGYSNPASCQSIDVLIASGVKSFTVDYYLNSKESLPIANQYTNGSVLTNAMTIVLTLTTTSGKGNNVLDSTSRMRITRLNS